MSPSVFPFIGSPDVNHETLGNTTGHDVVTDEWCHGTCYSVSATVGVANDCSECPGMPGYEANVRF